MVLEMFGTFMLKVFVEFSEEYVTFPQESFVI